MQSGNRADLEATALALVAPNKGILAADESTSTIGKRFAAIGIESTETSRRDYRHLLFSAPGAARAISGVILYDETIRQKAPDGTPLPQLLQAQGIIPGIKVDTGAKDMPLHPGEKITEGLDGLAERLQEYHALGARFAKWRAVITISSSKDAARLPTQGNLHANAHALARYAALCQEAGLVPIVEPEVLMDADNTVARCEEVTTAAWSEVFTELRTMGVHLPGILLKPNMVVAGKKSSQQAKPQEVAERTVRLLRQYVPPAVPGIVFLSGGQSPQEATEHLRLMNTLGPQPWKLTFSYGRALQEPALKAWGGKAANIPAAQQAFMDVARANSAACSGKTLAQVQV